MPENVSSGKNKYLSYLLRFLVASIALYFVFRGENITELGRVFSRVHVLTFITGIGLFILSSVLIALRWNYLLRSQGIRISSFAAIKLTFLGLFYNNFLPSSVGGDFVRAWYVTKHTDKRLEAALSVFIDRVVGLGGLILMAMGCYLFFPLEEGDQNFVIEYKVNIFEPFYRYRLVIGGILAIIVVVFVLVWFNDRGRAWLKNVLSPVLIRGGELVRRMFKAVILYCKRPLVLVVATIMTFGAQGVFVIALWLLGREVGVNVAMKYYFVFFPISWVIGALPISIGGLGIVEGGLKAMFAQVGVRGNEALVLALCQRLILLVSSLPGAAIHLAGAHLPDKEFFIDCEGSAN